MRKCTPLTHLLFLKIKIYWFLFYYFSFWRKVLFRQTYPEANWWKHEQQMAAFCIWLFVPLWFWFCCVHLHFCYLSFFYCVFFSFCVCYCAAQIVVRFLAWFLALKWHFCWKVVVALGDTNLRWPTCYLIVCWFFIHFQLHFHFAHFSIIRWWWHLFLSFFEVFCSMISLTDL